MICVCANVLVSYSFSAELTHMYQVNVALEGTLPILGGKEGKATIEFRLRVQGSPANQNQATYELTSFRSTLNGSILPFGLANVSEFFPKSKFTYQATGEITDTTAPKKTLPASLPGFDSQRIPEISFMPIVLKDQAGEWTFERQMNGAPIRYKVRLQKPELPNVFSFQAEQSRTTFETDSHLPIQGQEGSTFEVQSTLLANGVANFDEGRKLLKDCLTTIQVETRSTNRASKESSIRRLVLRIETKLL